MDLLCNEALFVSLSDCKFISIVTKEQVYGSFYFCTEAELKTARKLTKPDFIKNYFFQEKVGGMLLLGSP